MNEFEQVMEQELRDDYMERASIDHELMEQERLLRAYAENTREAAVEMADAAYSKHGNYPGALVEVCHLLIRLAGARALADLAEQSKTDTSDRDLF